MTDLPLTDVQTRAGIAHAKQWEPVRRLLLCTLSRNEHDLEAAVRNDPGVFAEFAETVADYLAWRSVDTVMLEAACSRLQRVIERNRPGDPTGA